MSKSAYFVLEDTTKATNCINTIAAYWQRQHEAGKTLAVTIKRVNRSYRQNKRYWAILARVSEQLRPLNKQYSSEVWHEHFKREFLGVEPLPSGNYMAKSSAKLSVDEFAEYMTQVEAWAVDNGVNLNFLD